MPRCTSNDCSGGVTIRSSSAHWNHDLAPWKAFNKDTSSWPQGFCLEGRTGWLTIDFPSPVTVTSYKIHGRQDALTYSPKNWAFQGTNGNDAWTTLDTQRNLVVRGPMTATWVSDALFDRDPPDPVICSPHTQTRTWRENAHTHRAFSGRAPPGVLGCAH